MLGVYAGKRQHVYRQNDLNNSTQKNAYNRESTTCVFVLRKSSNVIENQMNANRKITINSKH